MAEMVLRFMACSDLHFKDEDSCKEKARFEAGLKQLYAYARSQDYKNVDAIYIVGDFANCGSLLQMKSVKASLDKLVQNETKVILTMGSHEYFGENKEEGGRARFAEVFGQEPNTHEVINGFHFIGVTTTDGCHFHDVEKDFTAKSLEEAHADTPNKPVFFFQHPHITDTIYGSIGWGEDEITPILVNYPQVIDFSGHSHAPINDPRNIHQQHFTSVGTGTFSYFELDEFEKIYGTKPPRNDKAAQMVIVEAYSDGSVEIKPYDCITDRFFDVSWKIDTPWEPDSFIYTREKRLREAKKPYFDNSAVETAVNGDSLTVKFKQAKCELEPVNDYIVTIRSADGYVARRFTIWSEYYFADMPEFVEYTIDGLKKGDYTVTVRARGFWENYSDDVISAEFTV